MTFTSLHTMRRTALFLLLNGLLSSGLAWNNDYDKPLNFACPAGYSINTIKSQHSDYYEDRQWSFSCKYDSDKSTGCFWSSYANDFDEYLMFECPNKYVIGGISSYHSNYYEDRRWKFYCCERKRSGTCQWTSYVNYFDELFYWTVPPSSVLVGAASYHQNRQEDRRWQFKYCVQTSL